MVIMAMMYLVGLKARNTVRVRVRVRVRGLGVGL
jgi:hypothetical protein